MTDIVEVTTTRTIVTENTITNVALLVLLAPQVVLALLA